MFLAPDRAPLAGAQARIREVLAWKNIVHSAACPQRKEAEGKQLEAGLRETWSWALWPYRTGGTRDSLDWEARLLAGAGRLFERAVRKFVQERASASS